jgi:hypothetical protein
VLFLLNLSRTELFSVILISLNSVATTAFAVVDENKKNSEEIFFIPEFGTPQRKSQMSKIVDEGMVKVAIYNNNAYWVFNNMIHKARIDGSGNIHDEEAIVVDVFQLSEKEVGNLLSIIDSISY